MLLIADACFIVLLLYYSQLGQLFSNNSWPLVAVIVAAVIADVVVPAAVVAVVLAVVAVFVASSLTTAVMITVHIDDTTLM